MSESPAASLTFEEALQQLQQIVGDLEGGQLTLEASLQQFEDGMRLLRTCYTQLERAEQKIELLVSLDAQGQLVTQPFDATATVEQTPATAAKAPRKRTPRSLLPDDGPN